MRQSLKQSHLKLADKRLGYLVNFNLVPLKDGFKRFVNFSNSIVLIGSVTFNRVHNRFLFLKWFAAVVKFMSAGSQCRESKTHYRLAMYFSKIVGSSFRIHFGII